MGYSIRSFNQSIFEEGIDVSLDKFLEQSGPVINSELEFLAPMRVSILSERRETRPFGLFGAEPGAEGRNILIRQGKEVLLKGKTQVDVMVGDSIVIETPGGGGFQPPD